MALKRRIPALEDGVHAHEAWPNDFVRPLPLHPYMRSLFGIAKRFQVQILLSIDLPPATHLLDSSAGMPTGGGVPGMDPLGDKLYMGLERALVRVLEKALV